MALTPSNMLPLGTPAPDFSLPDTASGRHVSLAELAPGEPLAVMFICNHCPFVKHVRSELAAFARHYQTLGVGFVAISSNDVVNYPDDGPEKMKEESRSTGYPFPYLYDESQDVARAYRAACTPDFYLFDASRRLAYRGQFDSSRPNNGVPVTGTDLADAIHALREGRRPTSDQKPSIGCNIKWKA